MNQTIFSHECIEHKKPIMRNVWLMDFSVNNLKRLWEKSQEHRILFSDDVNGDFHKFCSIFMSQDYEGNITANGLLWVVDDFVGILFMSNIKTREALLHFSFFDGRLRKDISIRMIMYIFDNYEFDRLSADIVPFASPRVFSFVEDIGFKQEGKKRKGLIYKGEKFDLIQYGLLREEFEEKWGTMREQLAEAQQKD